MLDAHSTSLQDNTTYLQEWNKVLLLQIRAARLSQKVKKFGCIIMTGLQHSEQETDALRHLCLSENMDFKSVDFTRTTSDLCVLKTTLQYLCLAISDRQQGSNTDLIHVMYTSISAELALGS